MFVCLLLAVIAIDDAVCYFIMLLLKGFPKRTKKLGGKRAIRNGEKTQLYPCLRLYIIYLLIYYRILLCSPSCAVTLVRIPIVD